MSFLRHISIKQKLRLMLLATSGAALVLACAAFVVFGLVGFQKEVERGLAMLADLISYSAEAPLDFDRPEDGKEVINYLRASPDILAGCLYRPDGSVFTNYSRADVQVPPPQPPPSEGFHPKTLEFVKVIRHGDGKHLGAVYLRFDRQTVDRFLWRCLAVVGVIMRLASLAALLLAARFQRAITEPILHLWRTAKTVSEEKNYAVRAARFGADELG